MPDKKKQTNAPDLLGGGYAAVGDEDQELDPEFQKYARTHKLDNLLQPTPRTTAVLPMPMSIPGPRPQETTFQQLNRYGRYILAG
jgi:hypothetical protein